MSRLGPAFGADAPSLSERLFGFWSPRRLVFPILMIMSVFLVMQGHSPGLADPDYYWHLKTGELIWQTGALPQGDPFSWTFQDRTWVLHEWLFQVLLYLVHDAFGPGGVAVMTAVMLALIWYLAFATADRMIRRPGICFFLSLALGAGIVASGAPRPHLVSLLFFAISLAIVFHAKYSGRHRWLCVLPLFMIVWVNSHGGYAIGIAMMLAFAALEWLNLALRYRDKQQVVFCIWLSAIAAAVVAASVLNPYGIAHWEYPFYVAQLDLTSAILEWRSIMTSETRGLWYALGGVLWAGLVIWNGRKLDATEFLFPMALFVAGLYQARHAPFASLAMIVFIAPALYNPDRVSPRLTSRPLLALGWVFALGAFVVPALFARGPYVEAIEEVMPSDIVSFIEKNNLTGRMFNEYGVGGFLIDRLAPDRKVFIDGRADLYGDAFYKHYLETLKGQVPPERHFDTWEIEYAILRHRQPLLHMLVARGDYRLVFEGRTYSLLIREDGVNSETLAKFPPLGD